MYNKISQFLIIILFGLVFYIITSCIRIENNESSNVSACSAETEEIITLNEFHGPYDVTRIVDGDTLVVSINGDDTKVRMIGVDTPESVNPDDSKNTEQGNVASDYTKELLNGTKVYLEYDIDITDDYGRALAYVYLSDGATMVNRLLLERGYAQVMTVQPNSKYADDFYRIQAQARDFGTGVWDAFYMQW